MKVRIGVSLSVAGADGDRSTMLADAVDRLDDLGFDSIWLPEVLTAPTLGPIAGLAFAAARRPRLKLGTTMLLPGRNPVRLAKELATLDVLSGGRLLCTFVPGLPHDPERAAVGVDAADRGALMDEMLPLMRALWSGRAVSHQGRAGQFDGVTVAPGPAQDPLEFWTGGSARAALVRCGRLADGWLPSACTPDEAASGRSTIEEVAQAAGRSISPEHFGVSLAYATEPLTTSESGSFARLRSGVDPGRVVPIGIEALRSRIEEFLAMGFSKFVVRPLRPPPSWAAELDVLAGGVLDLQT